MSDSTSTPPRLTIALNEPTEKHLHALKARCNRIAKDCTDNVLEHETKFKRSLFLSSIVLLVIIVCLEVHLKQLLTPFVKTLEIASVLFVLGLWNRYSKETNEQETRQTIVEKMQKLIDEENNNFYYKSANHFVLQADTSTGDVDIKIDPISTVPTQVDHQMHGSP
jgi:hypothetical protein